MKKTLTLFAALVLLAATATAQKLSYSAVVRNSANELQANKTLTVGITITNEAPGATVTPVYSETQTVTTNQNGLVTLMIGDGTNVTGSLSDVTWQTAYITSNYTMPDGSQVLNTTPVTAVPYALYAEIISADALVGAVASLTEEQKAGVLAALGLNGGGGDTPGGDTPGGGDENPCGTMVDANGNVYETVKMGILDNDGVDHGHYRCWTKTNLRATKGYHPDNGAEIDFDEFYNTFASQPGVSQVAWCYSAVLDNSAILSGTGHYASPVDYPVDSYGYLYNFLAAISVCPPGWHLPSQDEWTNLFQYVASKEDNCCDGKIAKALASKGGWHSSDVVCAVGNNPASNNNTGFSVFPAGVNSVNLSISSPEDLPMFSLMPASTVAAFWYLDEVLLSQVAGNIFLSYDNPQYMLIMPYGGGETIGDLSASHFSVRCVKDN